MFKPRMDAKTKVKIINIPQVNITTNAYAKMTHIVNGCDKEVGWLGTVNWDRENNTIFIEDIYLFEQEVNYTTCEISPEGLAKFAEELLQQSNGVEIWNNIKLWGHSHVNMEVSPSGQDNDQMDTFADHNDWFLRIIANKKGDLKIDLFDYTSNIYFEDLPWNIYIEELVTIKPLIDKEIKEKVKEKKYANAYTNGYGYLGYSKSKKKKEDNITDIYDYYEELYKEDFDDYSLMFSDNEIFEIATAPNYSSAENIMKKILGDVYSDEELNEMYYDCISAFYNTNIDYIDYKEKEDK